MGNPANLRPRAPFTSKDQPAKRGRTKGSKNRATILRRWLEVKREIDGKKNPSGESVKGTVADEIALALISKALKGDVSAIREVLDRSEGKVKDQIEHSGEDGGPLEIVVRHVHASND